MILAESLVYFITTDLKVQLVRIVDPVYKKKMQQFPLNEPFSLCMLLHHTAACVPPRIHLLLVFSINNNNNVL